MNDKVVFLSPSTQEFNVGYGNFGTEEYRMNRIGDIVERLLKNQGYNSQGPEIFANRPNTPGDRLANDIYDEIIKIYPYPDKGRGVLYTSSLYEIIRTNAPAVLLEVAFHDNADDANWIINNEEEIAQAIVNGINNYFSTLAKA